MTVSRHIPSDMLVAYAAGSLAEGWSLAVATHLSLCAPCRAELAEASALGGAMLEAAEPVALSNMSLTEALARIDAVPVEPRRARPVRTDTVIPEPLLSYVGGDVDQLGWKKIGSSGFQLPIQTGDRETSVRLLRIRAGQPVPEHGHRGPELTLVLAGSLVDGDTRFVRGEVEMADEEIEHEPRAGEGEDCICLAVTDAPLRFSSLMVRLAQPFLKF